MSQGLLALMQNPDQHDRLAADPGLVPRAVEEVLRYGSPVMYFRRTATRDTEIRGVPVAKGDKVVMWYVSANYDEETFPDPYRFDVGREAPESTSFGIGGPHYCLGAWLARLEIRILLEEILARGLRFELASPSACGRTSSTASTTCRPGSRPADRNGGRAA